jgi:hypothetical protein
VWSVQEGATGGTIDANGRYTAPATSGTVHIRATSVVDPTAVSTATADVQQVGVFIYPPAEGLLPGANRQFTATVNGTVLNTTVSWSVEGGNASGTVSSDGHYTAPSTAGGPFRLVATSAADPTKTAVAQIWVDTRTFRQVGDTVLARTNHTATRLTDGTVLLTGGAGQAGSPDPGTEIFDPLTSTFHAGPQMSEVRYGHTATLLPNGKVLIIGGKNTDSDCVQCSSAAAEIFDPATMTFSPTGSMFEARSFHTATLLQDGTVFVAGGAGNDDFTPFSYEIYHPTTGEFTTNYDQLEVPRISHTATLLSNGTVLLAGGEDSYSKTFSAEIFDPISGMKTPTDVAPRSRNGHTATLLSNGRILIAGGEAQGHYYSQAKIFNPGTIGSEDVPLVTPRAFHTATVLSAGTDQILMVGGTKSNGDPGDSAEIFEATQGVFRRTANLLRPRSGHTATILTDGRVLITGGSGDHSAEVLPSETNPGSFTQNWELAPTDGMVKIIRAALNMTGSFVEGAAIVVDTHGCFFKDLGGGSSSPASIYFSGALSADGSISTSSSPYNGQIFSFHGTLSNDGATITAASYQVKGGCADGEVGGLLGTRIQSLTGTYSGTMMLNGNPLATTVQLTQSVQTDSDGKFHFTGTYKINGTGCSVEYPLLTTQSVILGKELWLYTNDPYFDGILFGQPNADASQLDLEGYPYVDGCTAGAMGTLQRQ